MYILYNFSIISDMDKMNHKYDAIVITHGGCQDGTAAAWVVRQYLNRDEQKNIRYVFATGRDLNKDLLSTKWKDSNGIIYPALTLDDFRDTDVYILDYMYPIDQIKRIPYKTLTVIDHHHGNKEVLEECKRLDDGYLKVKVFFDERYSAAGLAWRLLMKDGDSTIPWWIEYIQDRDLFKFSLPHSREINDAMYNLKYRSFSKFDELNTFTAEQKERFIGQGLIISNVKTEIIQGIVRNAYKCIFEGHNVYVVETGVLVSEVGESLYTTYEKSCDFVMCIYYDFKMKEFKCRLRSHKESSIDLSLVAKRYGGGGHRCAAAFTYKGDIFSLFEGC
jgi:uncharacterized protein